MIDQLNLGREINRAAGRQRLIINPHTLEDRATTEVGIVMQATALGLDAAIANANQRNIEAGRFIYSTITPFNAHQQAPTLTRIIEATARAARATRFTGGTGTIRLNIFGPGDRVRVTDNEEELERYGAEDVAGMTGTIDRPYEDGELVLDTAAWYVQIDGDGEWYIQANHLELLP